MGLIIRVQPGCRPAAASRSAAAWALACAASLCSSTRSCAVSSASSSRAASSSAACSNAGSPSASRSARSVSARSLRVVRHRRACRGVPCTGSPRAARCPAPGRRVVFRVVGERLLAAAEQGWRAHLPHRGGDRQGHEQLRADELLRGEDVDAVDCADREPSTGAALTCPRLAAGFDEGQGGVATLGVLVGRPGRGQLRVDRVAQAPGVVCFERRVERRKLVGEAGDLAADPGQPPAPCVEGFPVGLLQCVEPADGLVELDLAEIAGVTGGDGLGRGRGLADIAAAEVLDLADVDLVAFGLLDEQCLAFHFLPHHACRRCLRRRS